MRPPLRYRVVLLICRFLHICVKMPHLGAVFSQCGTTYAAYLL
jgi:hypothetical protein